MELSQHNNRKNATLKKKATPTIIDLYYDINSIILTLSGLVRQIYICCVV